MQQTPHDTTTIDDHPRGLRIGELLVRQGVLTPRQASHVLDVQAATHRPFGDLCERLFGVDPGRVESAWAEQFAALHGEADVARVRPDPRCLRWLNPRQAWQFRLVPLRVELDDEDGPGHALVAAGRSSLRRSMTFAARTLPVAPSFVLATPASLRSLLEGAYPIDRAAADYAFGRG